MESINNRYAIIGGNPVSGKIRCMGAKNLATKVMVASLLAETPSNLYNIPNIGDVEITQSLIESSGAITKRNEDHMFIDPSSISKSNIMMPDSRTNRIPILVLSVLLQKLHECTVPIVGGDNIGKRKVDFHINAIKQFGADVKFENNQYKASRKHKLQATNITLPYPSVGATETCLFLAVLAEGTSIIRNPATEPEIIELITMLNLMGAIIIMNKDREIVVHGTDKLYGTNFKIIGDRIEAASWASLAGASDGRISVSGIRASTMYNFLPYYRMAGGGYKIVNDNEIEFFRRCEMSAIDLETNFYPGFSTDWQQPFATMLTQAHGESKIHETVHDNRFGYLSALQTLGATTKSTEKCVIGSGCRYHKLKHKHSALIYGPTPLKAPNNAIQVPDLRAGLAYVIAAAIASGETILEDIHHIERGYGNLVDRLAETNINIRKLT